MTNGKIKKLIVSTPQGSSGELHRESRFSFNYTTGERAAEVSLLMPIRAASYTSGALPIVFAMNRPEGEQLLRITSKFSKLGGLDEMQLLSILGDNQIGRLSYAEPDVARSVSRPKIGLKELLRHQASAELFEFLVDAHVEAGISGVQPKVMIPDADAMTPVDGKVTALHSNLIVKSGGGEYPFLAQNEFLCMTAAKRSEISVPPFWLSDSGGLFIMDRFDLRDGEALGFEDMSVLQGKEPDVRGDFKYQSSYENIAKALQLYCRGNALESKQRLFEYVALSVMVRNGDAHLKNFGVLYEHPTAAVAPSLSPLYDVVTTKVYSHTNQHTGVEKVDPFMALNMRKDKSYPTRETLVRFGADVCHVAKPQDVIERIGTAMQETLLAEKSRIDPVFLTRMSSVWDEGRMSVQPSQFFVSRKEPASAPDVVASGEFAGAILKVEEGIVVQKIGRDPEKTARHAAAKLTRVPAVAEVCGIKYDDQGVGQVSEQALAKDIQR